MTEPAPPPGDFEVEITAEHLAFYRENGYLTLDRITTDDEVAWIGSVFDELFADTSGGILVGYLDATRGYGSEGVAPLGQVVFPERREPALLDTLFHRNARRIASQLMAVDVDELQCWGHMLHKPAGFGDETPWHQDEAYWEDDLTYEAIGAWLALDDATVDNGCLWYLPGSHRLEVLPHRHLRDDPAVHAITLDTDLDTSAGVPVPLPAGGIAFHHPRTVHRAGPNVSDGRRRSFSYEFQTEPVRRAEPVDRPWVRSRREALAAEFARLASTS